MAENKELVTAQALADALGLSVETIWRYTRENKIPYIKLGKRQYRYNLQDVMQALSGSSSAIARDNSAQYQSGDNKPFTYQDYLQLPDKPGYRYEVLEGILVKDPSPNVMHQRVSRRLQRNLEDYFWSVDPDGEVFYAPLDTTLGEINVVQPDLFYVSGEQKNIIKEARIDGSPTLIVEILSPTSRRKDRLQKMRIYQKAWVQHYWIVDPEEKTLECFALREGVYALVATGMEENVVEHADFPGLGISLKAVMAR